MTSKLNLDLDLDADYIISERYIHDNLRAQATSMLPAIAESWREKQAVDPFLVSWLEKPLTADDGQVITHFVLVELGTDRQVWHAKFVELLERTHPYALLLVEQTDKEVIATFESRHGSRSWRYPINDHGGTRVLGAPMVRDDVDSIGILWQKAEARAEA